MRSFLIALTVLALLAPSLSIATTTSGTVSVATGDRYRYTVVTWDWMADTNGVVLDNTATGFGEIMRVTFVPDSGTSAPTALYDVTIEDRDGYDVLGGLGADRSASSAEVIQPALSRTVTQTNTLDHYTELTTVTTSIDYEHTTGTTTVSGTAYSPVTVYGVLELNVSNAGSGKAGQIRMYLRRD